MTYTLIIKTYWYSLKLINYFIHLVQIVIIYSMLCSVGLAAEQISSYVKECYKMDGDPDGQISTCSRVIDAGHIANKHDFSLAYHMRALGYARKNDITKALSDIDRAIEIEPEYFAHYLNRANILDALGKHDRAIEDYNNSIKLNEKCVDCYYNRGVSLGQHNDIDGAVINFKKAIELSPNNLPARIAMARIAVGRLNSKAHDFMQQQKYPEALDALTKAIHIIEWKKEPRDWDYVLTLTYLGEVYRKMKRYDNALATMERALVVTESLFGHDNIKIALPVTDLALLNIEVGRFKEAQSVVARGLSILRSQRTKKPLFIYLTQLSEKYVAMNKCADASPYIQAAKRIYEENPEESDVGFNIKLQSLLNKCVKDKSKSTRNSQYSSRLNDAEYDAVQSMDSALSCHGGKIQRIGRSDGGEEILMCVQ